MYHISYIIYIFFLACWILVLNLVKVRKKQRTETLWSSINTDQCEGYYIISIVANIIGKNTTRHNFCYHIWAGDHCTMKSIRQFPKGEKTVQKDCSLQNIIRVGVLWKINLWASAWPRPTSALNWVYNTEFYCLTFW